MDTIEISFSPQNKTARVASGTNLLEAARGAFGRWIRMENFARLRVFPRELLDRVTLVGNSSKADAALCLLSKNKREEAAVISRNIQFAGLPRYQDYDKLFARCLAFREE